MNHRMTLCSLALSALALPLLAHAEKGHADKVHAHEWEYVGATGPAKWGKLKSDYAACKLGHQQSPINIAGATQKEKLDPIVFDYHPSALKVIDNGHTIQVNTAAGSGMSIGGAHYDLLQFHFHTPSEEQFNGKPYPLVAHLVHKNAEGKLAVVALLFKEGKENPMLANVWSHLPTQKKVEQAAEGVTIDITPALPSTQNYYNFAGSLTTPPCSEEVNWFILKTPVEMSHAQLTKFRTMYKHNARPVQPLFARVVKESM